MVKLSLILVSGGVTALMWAAKEGQKNTLCLLIEANANVHAFDEYCALRSLLRPPLTPTCSEGKSALVHAACAGQSGIVRLLLEGRSHEDIVQLLVL